MKFSKLMLFSSVVAAVGFVSVVEAAGQVETVYIHKDVYSRGEVLWVGRPKAINLSTTTTKALVDANAAWTTYGEPGVTLTTEANGTGPVQVVGEIPRATNWGYGAGLAITILGDLEFTYPGQTLTWHKDRWSLPHSVGKHSVTHVYSGNSSGENLSEAIFHGPKVNWVDLLNGADTATFTVTGNAKMALYCNADKCKIPSEGAAIQTDLVINVPVSDPFGKHAKFVDDFTKFKFVKLSQCSLTVNPPEFPLGVIQLQPGMAVPTLLKKDMKSNFSIVCGKDEKRKAHVVFGTNSPVPGVEGVVLPNTMAKTSLEGIGVVYSTSPVETCSDAMEFTQQIDIGPGPNGEFSGSTSKDFHFGICTYKPYKDIGRGDLIGSVQYNVWLD